MSYPQKLLCDPNRRLDQPYFSKHWEHSTLQEEVSRGALLRQQKPRHNNFRTNGVKSFYQPSTSTKSKFQALLSGESHCKSGKLKKVKTQKRCPIRLAELAAPTKRQCIESWRYNSSVLPIYMVDRLRQRVMNEKPIVQISDAVTCFKRRKKVPKNRSSKNSCLTSNRMREIKMLSAIFGFRITVKLLRPLNLSLNPGLNDINKIVKEEIDVLLRKKRKSHQRRFRKTVGNIVDEMARKITIWIDKILFDSNFKLLEESLRDLEEEEGPVLDFIDELMDKVADICEQYHNESSEESINKPVSVSTLPHLNNYFVFPKDSVKILIEEICREALENAERQKYNDSSSYLKITDVENEIELAAQDMDTVNLDEDYKKGMEIILWEIVENVITNKFQLNEKLSKNHDTEVDLLSKSNEEFTTNNLVKLDLKSDLVHENDKILKRDVIETLSSAYEKEPLTSSAFKENDKHNLPASEMYESNIVEENNDLEHDHEPNATLFQFKNSKTEDEFVKDIENKDKTETEIDLGEKSGFTDENKDNQNEIDEDITFNDVEDREEKLMSETILKKDKNKESTMDSFVDSKSQESGDDESEDKKVKFSDIDMGLGMKSPLPTNLSAQEIFQRLSSRENYKTNINLAPPNNSLLSDADESWPQHVPLPTIKVTESVNKSVTSLGKIFEADEKGLSTESSYDSIQVSEYKIIDTITSMSIDTNKIKDTLIEPFQNEKKVVGDNYSMKLDAHKKQSKRNNGKKELNNKKLSKSDHILKNTQNSKSPRFVSKNNTFNRTKIAPKKNDNEVKEKVSKDNNQRSKSILISNTNQTKIEKHTNVPKAIKNKLADNFDKPKGTKMKVKTVKEENASNSDFKKRGNDFNDASGNTKRKNIPYRRIKSSAQKKDKLKNIEEINTDTDDIFKWCKGLQNVIDNLETWNAWMNSTCECIKYLKRKGNAQSSRSIEKVRKKWKLLHKSIQQDRHLWKDTKRRNREGLMRYKKYYCESATEKNKCENCDCSNI